MEEFPKQKEQQLEIYENKYRKFKDRLIEIHNKKDQTELNELSVLVRRYASALAIDPEPILDEINKGLELENPNLFAEKVFSVCKEIIDQSIQHPEFFEDIRRESILDHDGNIRLSELMYCGFNPETGIVEIHIAPKGTMSFADIIRAFREGMIELARFVEKNTGVKEIEASSWIVASNPKLLEKAGFEILGETDEETMRERFSEETRPVWTARMSREVLLEKYK